MGRRLGQVGHAKLGELPAKGGRGEVIVERVMTSIHISWKRDHDQVLAK